MSPSGGGILLLMGVDWRLIGCYVGRSDFLKNSAASAVGYRGGVLYVEGVAVTRLAEQFGTPLYVYSAGTLRRQYGELESNLGRLASRVLICYALKANANPAIGRMLAGLGAG